jgi:hypothetical protein
MKSRRWYLKDGTPCDDYERIERLMGDLAYKRVAETTLPDGKWISTVWLGLDHRFIDDGPPLIFETMVFSSEGGGVDLDQDRYSTEEEARTGHDAIVQKWSEAIK